MNLDLQILQTLTEIKNYQLAQTIMIALVLGLVGFQTLWVLLMTSKPD